MELALKTLLALFLLLWLGIGAWTLVKSEQLFNNPEDPSETPGSRSLNLTQVASVWLGIFGIGVYFLLR